MSALMDSLSSAVKPFFAVGSASPPARKAGKPTSYNSKGLGGIEQPDLDSEFGSSQGVVLREIVPELSSAFSRRTVYGTMQNDAGVDVSLRAIKTPVLGAEFFIEPASDDPQDKLIADFIWHNLAHGMSSPMTNSLEDILRFFEDGFSILEKVYELRPWSPTASGANSKNYTMLKKLGVRPESTIADIVYDDNGGPESIKHNAQRADGNVEEVEIPIGKLMVFTFNRKGGDIRGKSILRTAYPHWYYKTHLYKIDAIQKERHSLGVPKGKLLPGFNKTDQGILRTLLRNLRTNEESFLLLTPNVDVEFAKVEGNLVNVMESADHHNMMIMLNVMAQFLTNAASGAGGRSTSATQVDMFMKALRYIANYIAEVFNMYLVPELVVYNFPTTNFPKVRVKNIGEAADLQKLAAAIANMMAQGGITPDLETENFFRKIFDIPSKDENAIQTVDKNADAPPEKGNIKPGAVKTGNNGKPVNAPS